MDISSQMIMGTSGAFITLGTAYLTLQKILRSKKRDKDAERAEILQEAKEHTSLVKTKLEAKILVLETKLDTLEQSINKDMGHLKEIYANDMKALGEKIESLRDELRLQSAKTLELLTKMINS